MKTKTSKRETDSEICVRIVKKYFEYDLNNNLTGVDRFIDLEVLFTPKELRVIKKLTKHKMRN